MTAAAIRWRTRRNQLGCGSAGSTLDRLSARPWAARFFSSLSEPQIKRGLKNLLIIRHCLDAARRRFLKNIKKR